MNARQSSLLGLAMCAVALGLSAFWWGHLPDPMPIHFGPDGRPDGWGSRTLGTLLMPGLMLALHARPGACRTLRRNTLKQYLGRIILRVLSSRFCF